MPLGHWYVKRFKRALAVLLITLTIGILVGEWGVYILILAATYDAYKLAKKESAPFNFLGRVGLA